MSAVAYAAQYISRERSVHRHNIIERSTIDVGNPPSTASDNSGKSFNSIFIILLLSLLRVGIISIIILNRLYLSAMGTNGDFAFTPPVTLKPLEGILCS